MTYYHVRIISRSDPSRTEVRLDLSLEELMQRFVVPYRQGLPLVIAGTTIPSDNIQRVKISQSEQDSKRLKETIDKNRPKSGILINGATTSWDIANTAKDVTDDFITGPPGSEMQEYTQPVRELVPPANAREVFVVHGRNIAARDALFEFLRASDLHPLEWSEAVGATGKTSPYIGEILDAAFSRAHAVVVLFTPDDEARLRQELRGDSAPPHETELTGQARPDVLFEAGMAMGRNQNRTVLVELGNLRPFSDISGLHIIRMDGSSQRRQELAQRLLTARCPVNLDGTDWHNAGDFEGAINHVSMSTSGRNVPSEREQSPSMIPSLTEEALFILSESSEDQMGLIHVIPTALGKVFQTNGKQFGRSGHRRVDAKHERALTELIELGLISDNSGEGKFFGVTTKGFEFLDTQLEVSP